MVVEELTPEEWNAAVEAALARVGVTREELKQQASEGNFVSTEARKLWYLIGER